MFNFVLLCSFSAWVGQILEDAISVVVGVMLEFVPLHSLVNIGLFASHITCLMFKVHSYQKMFAVQSTLSTMLFVS